MSKTITVSETTGRLALHSIVALMNIGESVGVKPPTDVMVATLDAVRELDTQLDQQIDPDLLALSDSFSNLLRNRAEPQEFSSLREKVAGYRQ